MDLMHRNLHLLLLVLAAFSWQPLPTLGQDQSRKAREEEHSYVSPPAWKSVEIGNFYFKRKNYAGALSRFKEATQVDPDYAPAYLGLGKVYEKIGLKRKALEAYQRYLDELPSSKQAEEDKSTHDAIARLEKELGTTLSKGANPP